MINREILDFIRAQRDAGTERPVIASMLSASGWSQADIASAFKMIDVLPPTPANPNTPGQSKAPSAPMIATAPQLASDYLSPKIKKPKTWIFPLLMTVAFFALAGGTAYAYVERLGPFAHPPYTERNLISGLLETASSISSATYDVSASLETVARDANATPYVAPAPDPKERLKYVSDVERVQKISDALSQLKWGKSAYGSTGLNLSNAPFTYTKTDNGNFSLRATFESDAAVLALRKNLSLFGASATSTTFNGKTVTFTKDSPNFLFIPSEPPTSYLETLNETAQYLPADIKGTVAVAVTASFGKESGDAHDGQLTFSANADLGDLSYAVDLEGRKVGDTYYFKLNKFPSILLGAESNFKGVWISVASSTLTQSTSLSYISRSIPQLQKSYEKQSAKLRSTLATVAQVADDAHVLEFTKPPVAESVNGVAAYRYEVSVRKDAVADFYTLLKKQLDADSLALLQNTPLDPALASYVDDPSFSATFDYIKQNTFIRLWVDALGKPVKVEYQLRIVPPDTAKNYAGKQVLVTFDDSVSKINQSVHVEAPDSSKPLEDILKEQIAVAGVKATDAAVKADLEMMRAEGELYYNDRGSYGAATDSCSGGIFAATGMQKMIVEIKKNAGGTVSCHGNATGWATSAKLSVGTYFCVDSSGTAREQGASLKNGETKCVALVTE